MYEGRRTERDLYDRKKKRKDMQNLEDGITYDIYDLTDHSTIEGDKEKEYSYPGTSQNDNKLRGNNSAGTSQYVRYVSTVNKYQDVYMRRGSQRVNY